MKYSMPRLVKIFFQQSRHGSSFGRVAVKPAKAMVWSSFKDKPRWLQTARLPDPDHASAHEYTTYVGIRVHCMLTGVRKNSYVDKQAH